MSDQPSGPPSADPTIVDPVLDGTELPGKLVGSSGLTYKPLRQLGEGGMALVFLACAYGSAGFSKLSVVKMMRRHLDHPSLREMFLEEARVSAGLNHPNLVQVYEVVDTGEVPYMVMEYLEGKPLSKLRRGALPREMFLTIVSEALVGLHHAHEAHDLEGQLLKLVHRDVSPHNIFVTYDGAVKILDFGIAKTVGGKGHTQTGEVKGKLSYMAPEQLLGDPLDRRADVFSMGCVLWEMMLGSTMWANVDQGVLIQRLASGEIPQPRDVQPDIDPGLEEILVRATASEPDNRYQSALEMQQALVAYRDSIGKAFSSRQVGKAMADAFEAERTAEREAVRAALEVPSMPPPSLEFAEATEDQPAPPPERRMAPWLIGGAAALVFVGIFAKLGTAPRDSATRPGASAAAQAPRSAHIVFRVSPPLSRVEVDGELRGTGTFELIVPVDTREHNVRVSAQGYSEVTQTIHFEGTQTLDVVLAVETPMAAPASSKDAAPVASAKDPTRTFKGVLPPALTHKTETDAVPSAKPQDTNPCDPPYYFKNGIKTFRQECL
ncbi:MAG: serine/threonine-protein kinase [Polyangiaceae bacterium]